MPEPMEGGNPDAVQDRSLIQSVIQEELGPIFEVIASRFRDLDEDLGQARDLLFKFTQGLIETADGHKKTMLSGELSSKYGKDIEPFDGFYKDTQGKGFSDSIIEELMSSDLDEGGRDEFIKGKLGEAKGKYGKYLGLSDEKPAVVEEKKVEVAAAPEGEKEEKAEGEEGSPKDAVGSLMAQVSNLGGKKHKLSSGK